MVTPLRTRRPFGLSPHRLVPVLLMVSGWLLVALAAAGQDYMVHTMREGSEHYPFWRSLRWPLYYWTGWVLLTPPVFAMARRLPLTGAHRWRNALLLALGCCAAFVLHGAYQVLVMYLPPFDHLHPDLTDAVAYHATSSLAPNLGAYWVVVGAAYAVEYYRRYRRRELDAVHLETQLARAELQALRMQLHPHFLFNTLHAVSTLMYRDVRAADRMLAQLGELLRISIDRASEGQVELDDELAFVERYLQIEQARFGDRLAVTLDVDPAVRAARVPSFVLQPFVENALKHGVAPRTGPAHVGVRAWSEGGRLRLRVWDDGPGLDGRLPARHGTGVGLANTRARLDRLYGSGYQMALGDAGGRGLAVDLTLPLHLDAPAEVPV